MADADGKSHPRTPCKLNLYGYGFNSLENIMSPKIITVLEGMLVRIPLGVRGSGITLNNKSIYLQGRESVIKKKFPSFSG